MNKEITRLAFTIRLVRVQMKKYRFGAEMSFFRAKVSGIAQMCFVLCFHHSRRLKGNAQRVVKTGCENYFTT